MFLNFGGRILSIRRRQDIDLETTKNTMTTIGLKNSYLRGNKMKQINQPMNQEKAIYETPTIEIVEFSLEESIALSGDFGSGTICGEEIFG